ncbi:HlyD family efflux transporter periplasmic adaptor subunit [Streptococcus mutans]|uniref:HlyD family efflux transporter periplasmic adaptor subunit n=2 Tax=Streptococcus mutans TaxID=1309 RepID=UPI0014559FDF|nr:HlyD family efflux transporter periplasmic adaptor subunit [Streptococcus mutans]NLQ55936.1 HlyD family efflux transporter periplasmic adaptor subunit [Streptococcus mutans]
MNPNLFKSAEFYRRRYHNFATVLIIPLVCLLVFLFIFLLFAKKEVTVLSDGEISPIKVIDVIQSKSDYPISENNLTDNHAVKKGDVLIQYVNPAANTRQGGNNQNQNQSQNKQNKNQQQNNKNQKNGNQGQKNQNQNQNKNQSQNKQNGNQNQNNWNQNNQNDKVTASQDGVIHTNPKYEGENLIPRGTEIAQLYPDINKTRQVLITYYVSSKDVTRLKQGQKTRLALTKVGNDQISIRGKINSIASAATTTKKSNVFKVTAKAKVSKKDSQTIKYGLQGKTITVVEKKTFFDYYKDKLLNKNQK